MTSAKQYSLDPMYLNLRRLVVLLGEERVRESQNAAQRGWNDKISEWAELAACSEALREWLANVRPSPKPIQLLDPDSEIKAGVLFTAFRNFICKGVAKAALAKRATGRAAQGSSARVSPTVYATYRGLLGLPEVRLELKLHADHIVSGSPSELLQGNVADLFVVAVVHSIGDAVIEAVPIFIGRLISGVGTSKRPRSWTGTEVWPESIDNLAQVQRESPPTRDDLSALRTVPESDIKQAFAELFDEAAVPKDWGGEQSDLVATHVRINGHRVSTAIVFKGPAQFKPMTLAQLGKNGDQLYRLAQEPCDLLVVQHCHDITQPIRYHMRAICNQIHLPPRRYMLLDGSATLRVLRAYSKCGFAPSARA
jgi:hypothetical protein